MEVAQKSIVFTTVFPITTCQWWIVSAFNSVGELSRPTIALLKLQCFVWPAGCRSSAVEQFSVSVVVFYLLNTACKPASLAPGLFIWSQLFVISEFQNLKMKMLQVLSDAVLSSNSTISHFEYAHTHHPTL